MAHPLSNDYSTCFGNDKQEHSLLRLVRLEDGEQYELEVKGDKIMFLLEGQLDYNLEKYDYRHLSEGQMILLTAQNKFIGKASGDCLLIIIMIIDNPKVCDCFPLDQFMKESMFDYNYKNSPLEIKQVLKDYLSLLTIYIVNEMDCYHLQNIKVSELFYVLWKFYTKKELVDFFHPLISHDRKFTQQVLNNLPNVKNVKELSDAMNYSYSGFIKRFKKVFGVPVYTWMKQRKASIIYNEITSSDKTLSQISEEFGFSSQARFSDFCKAEFKMTATQIRNNRRNKDN